MNKELILKYKAEFDHSLYGGKLQVKFVNDPWEEAPEDIFSYSTVNFVLVIDDAYVEFRKALAEGKTIQCNAKEDENDITYTAYGHTWWADTTEFKYATTFYRIKPDELKFKAGDWIRQVKSNFSDYSRICKIVDCVENNLYSVETNIFDIDCINNTDESFELWQPKPDEYYWFWNKPSDIPILAKLISIEYFLERPTEYKIETPSCISETSYSYMKYMYFKNCEPFIGQLPSILKK